MNDGGRSDIRLLGRIELIQWRLVPFPYEPAVMEAPGISKQDQRQAAGHDEAYNQMHARTVLLGHCVADCAQCICYLAQYITTHVVPSCCFSLLPEL